jgi:hypothetical protein
MQNIGMSEARTAAVMLLSPTIPDLGKASPDTPCHRNSLIYSPVKCSGRRKGKEIWRTHNFSQQGKSAQENNATGHTNNDIGQGGRGDSFYFHEPWSQLAVAPML